MPELLYPVLQQLRRNGNCLLDILRPLETLLFSIRTFADR